MAAPVLVSVYGFPTATGSSPGTTFSTTVTAAAGDRLVACAIGTDTPPTYSAPTVPSGSGIVWTLVQSNATSNFCAINLWTGTVGTGFSSQPINIQVVSGTSSDLTSCGVWRWSGSAGFGVSGKVTTNPGAPSVNGALGLNSGIIWAYGDRNEGAAPTILTNAGSSVSDANQILSGEARLGAGHHLSSGSAGTKALGASAPTTAKSTFMFVEILASGALTATPADPVGITDAVTRVQVLSRAPADPVGITDAVTITPGKGTNDPVGITDAVIVTKGKVLPDPVGITDAVSIQRTVAKTLADPVVINDNVVITLVRQPIQDFQFVVPNYTPYVPFGRGQAVDVSKFSPGGFDLRTQDTNAARGDYRVFGTDRKVPPVWAWDMWTNCTSVKEATAWADLLATIWDDEVRQTPGGVLPLTYRIDGRFRRVYGRPGRFTPNYDKVHQGKVYITADFRLSEDTYYDEDEETLTTQSVPSPPGGTGIILPQPLPWVFTTQPVPRTELMTILGSKPTWVTPVFYGPSLNPWVQIGGLTWGLRGSIPAGQTVTLSGRPWDTGVIRSTGAYAPDMLDPRSRLSALAFKPGTYSVTYGGTDITGSSKVILRWRKANRTL